MLVSEGVELKNVTASYYRGKAQVCDSFYTGCGSSMVLRTTTMGYDDSEIKK